MNHIYLKFFKRLKRKNDIKKTNRKLMTRFVKSCVFFEATLNSIANFKSFLLPNSGLLALLYFQYLYN